MRFSLILVCILALLGCASEESSTDFPLTTLKNFQRFHRLPVGPISIEKERFALEANLPGLAAVVQYSGEVRPIEQKKQRLIQAIAESIGEPDFAQLYEQEIKVIEQRSEYWLPIQKQLLETVKPVVLPKQQIMVALRYVGASSDVGRVFVLINLATENVEPIPRSSVITEELLGVILGRDIDSVNLKLMLTYREPFKTGMYGLQKYYAYLIDENYKTQLIVRDAGEGFRQKLYSIQVVGPANPTLDLYGGLHLGDPRSKVEQVLGKAVEEYETEQGYLHLGFKTPRYSVELKDGVLASLLISDDPNYFAE